MPEAYQCSLRHSASPIRTDSALSSVPENIRSLQGMNSAFWLLSASCGQLDTLTPMHPDSSHCECSSQLFPFVLTHQALLSHWEHHDRDALCEQMGVGCHSHSGCELASAETLGTAGLLGAASGAWRQVSGTHGLSSSLEANRKILISLVCMIPTAPREHLEVGTLWVERNLEN